jgi:uncharacterized protein YkwD
MIQKHTVISMIAPVTVAGILIMTILAATANAQESNSTENAQQQSNNTENGQASSSTGNEQQQSNNTENAQQQSNNTVNAAASQESNNTVNAPTSQQSNSTGNAYCDSCNNDIYYGKMDFANMVLAVHNRERAAVHVDPLVWSNKVAAGAKLWAEHLVATGEFAHSSYTDRNGTGENLAARAPSTTAVPLAQMQQGWVAEKNSYQGKPSATGTNVTGHYTQMVWRATTAVGCGTASGGAGGGRDVLVCRYSPAGNTGGPPY